MGSEMCIRDSIESFTSQVTREVLGLKFPAPKQHSLPCPKCGTGKVMIRPKVAKCDNPDCGLLVFRKVLNKELNEQHLEQLLSSGATKLIKGFKGKKGVAFDASVTFDAGFTLTLSFPKNGNGRKRK